MKRLVALALAGVMVLSLAACGGNNSAKSEGSTAAKEETKAAGVTYPGTPDADMVTVDLRAEPPEMNSMLTTDVAAGDILRMTMAGLTRLDENDQPQPDIAESWDVSEDGTTYTFHLRKDAKWTNGEPVTANDFLYAYQLVCTPETGSAYAFIVYQNVKNGQEVYEGTKDMSELGVKVIDDYTLEVQFESPIPYALHLFSFSTYMPVNQKAYESIGAEAYAKDADTIVTNGAYTMTEWVHDDHLTLTKNEEYWDAQRIGVPTVKFLMMKDTNTRLNAFKAGQVDSIDLSGEQVEQLNNEGVETNSYIDNGNWYLQFNTQVKGLDNAKIRKALGMAIDLNSLCENVRKDGSVPATGLVPTGISGANGTKYADNRGNLMGEYNPDEAKKLFEEGLAEAGMTADELDLSLLMDDTTAAQKEAAFYQDQWKQVLGIDVEVTPAPFKSRLQDMTDGNFDIVFAGWSPDYNDPMTYLDMFTTTNGNNYGKYSSEEYDSLVNQAMQEVDVEKRQDMLIQAETLLVQTDVPVYPLYFSVKPYVVSSKVEGITRTGFQEWDFTDAAKIVEK